MKDEILRQLCSSESTVGVVFATVALGMGIDIRCIQKFIHVTPLYTIQAYFQETGRAGRDGESATAILYYNNWDIAKNKTGMQEAIQTYCQSEGKCLRNILLTSLDTEKYLKAILPKHTCCSVCQLECECFKCNTFQLK